MRGVLLLHVIPFIFIQLTILLFISRWQVEAASLIMPQSLVYAILLQPVIPVTFLGLIHLLDQTPPPCSRKALCIGIMHTDIERMPDVTGAYEDVKNMTEFLESTS